MESHIKSANLLVIPSVFGIFVTHYEGSEVPSRTFCTNDGQMYVQALLFVRGISIFLIVKNRSFYVRRNPVATLGESYEQIKGV